MAIREVELIDARDLSPSVKALRFRCLDRAPLAFTAGQWVNLFVPVPSGEQKRAYSIAGWDAPQGAETFVLAVTRVQGGDVSNVLHAASPGFRCGMDGPHGLFTRAGLLDQAAVLVGTGTGLAPLRAMLHEALGLPAQPPLQLLFGCRTEADILWRSELTEMAARHPSLTVHVTLSRPGESWPGMRGYVQDHLAEVIDVEARPHVFICGLTPMVKAVRTTLKQTLGYDRRRIHSERFD